jgi:hypothetical protein
MREGRPDRSLPVSRLRVADPPDLSAGVRRDNGEKSETVILVIYGCFWLFFIQKCYINTLSLAVYEYFDPLRVVLAPAPRSF